MQLNPYLTFNGDCEAAFKFYERTLGGKLALLLKYETAPPEENLPADWHGKIMHARLELGDRVLMGSDHLSQTPTEMQRCSMQLELQDADEAARIFHALSVNGQVTMPFGPTFWALRFGTLKDQFGVPWIINCEQTA
jgi:PhnB protein